MNQRAVRRPLGVAVRVGLMAVVALPIVFGPDMTTALAATPSPAPSPAQLFGVRPEKQGQTTLPGGHFNFALAADDHITDAMVVENFSDHSIAFSFYGADILSASGGGVAPAQATNVMHGVGAWMAVPNPKRTIGAHQEVTVPFTLTVPAGERPGQHLGAIVASADVGTTPTGSVIEARTALLVVVTLPGVASPSGRLGPLRVSPVAHQFVFGITLTNTGNLLLTYVGSITVRDAAGRSVARRSLVPSSGYVVPAGVILLTATWDDALPQSSAYTARATVTILADGEPVGVLTSQILQLPAPSDAAILIVIVALGCLAFLLLLLALARWSRRRAIPSRRLAVGRFS